MGFYLGKNKITPAIYHEPAPTPTETCSVDMATTAKDITIETVNYYATYESSVSDNEIEIEIEYIDSNDKTVSQTVVIPAIKISDDETGNVSQGRSLMSQYVFKDGVKGTSTTATINAKDYVKITFPKSYSYGYGSDSSGFFYFIDLNDEKKAKDGSRNEDVRGANYYIPETIFYIPVTTSLTKITIGRGIWDSSCFIEGTLVTLADGTKKPCEDITYDDDLLVYDFYEGKLSHAKPMWIKVPQVTNKYAKVTLSDGTFLGLVGENTKTKTHRLYNATKRKFMYPQEFELDKDLAMKEDGTFATIKSIETINEEIKYYNILTEKHYNLFTNRYLSSNRYSNRYLITDKMKYDTSKELMTEEEMKEYFEKRYRDIMLPKQQKEER